MYGIRSTIHPGYEFSSEGLSEGNYILAYLQFNDSTTAGPLHVRKSPSPFILVESSNDADGSTIPVDVPPAEGEVFGGAHSGSEGHSKKACLWGMHCSPEK
jgi:hypothetical protein